MVRQGGSKTTARIELKQQMANGGCQTVISVVVDIATIILHHPSSMMFSTPTTGSNESHAVVVFAVDAAESRLHQCGGVRRQG